jgi:hypothetical protein
MNKFIKRIRKIKKNPRFAIYLGSHHADIENFLELFPTIFWYKADDSSKSKKNLIYVSDLKFLNSLNEVEMVVVSDLEKPMVIDIQPLLIKSRPIILSRSADQISNEQSEFFKKIRYHATDLINGYQIWTHQ